jgi:hypothetical protein
MRTGLLLFALMAASGCEPSYEDKLQAKADKLGHDTTLADGEAAGRAAQECVVMRTRSAMVHKTDETHRQVAIFPQQLGFTNAGSLDALKTSFRWSMAREALCVLRATRDRGVTEVLIQQTLPLANKQKQVVYVAKLTLQVASSIEDWDKNTSDKIYKVAAERLQIIKEDFSGIELR